jgi:spore maturation protein CgeB
MKVLLFGKTRNVFHLVEDVAEDLRAAGHQVAVFAHRGTKLHKLLGPVLLSPTLGVPLAVLLTRAVRRFAPDLVVALGPYHWLPPSVFEPLAAMPGRPPMAAWVCDRFGAEAAAAANLFDITAYSDSGFLDLHRQFGFQSTSLFLPLAAVRTTPGTPHPTASRQARLAFVASATPARRDFLSHVTEPIALFGPDWRDTPEIAHHPRDARRISAAELPQIYRSHLGVLNIRHEANVINGLNQRHFAPYIQDAPVISDPQPDIAHCFDPGREILVYQDAETLNELIAALKREPARAHQIGAAGARRVRACHTYTDRIATLARAMGDARMVRASP